MSDPRAAHLLWLAALGLCALVPACATLDGSDADETIAWGSMGHGARQSQRNADGLVWSLSVRTPDVRLEVDGRSVVLKNVLARGVLRYALRDESTPRIWLELPDGARLDWSGTELASDDGYWRLEREGRYELSLGAEEPLAYLGP